MEANERQAQLGRGAVRTEWMRFEKLVAILLVLAASARGASTPRFKLEVQFPNGVSETQLLDIGRPATSGHPEVRVGTGPQGSWSEEHYVVTEFEVLSIGHHSVGLRFRVKRFDRLMNPEQATH